MAAVTKLKENRFLVTFVLFGHELAKTFDQESEAVEFHDRVLQTFPARDLALADAINLYLRNETDKRKSDRSRDDERVWFAELEQFLGSKSPVSAITRLKLEEFQTQLLENGSGSGREIKASSVNRRFHSIKNFFKKLEEWNFLKVNPARSIRRLPEKVSRRRKWTQLEIVRVFGFKFMEQDLRDLLELLLETGARLGSLLELESSKVDLIRGEIFFKQRKGTGEERVYGVPLSDRAISILSRRGAQAGGRYFTGCPALWSKRSSRLFRKLGVSPEVTIHGLRHTFASRLSIAGASTETIRLLLGHSSTRTTETYLHTDFEHLRKWVNQK